MLESGCTSSSRPKNDKVDEYIGSQEQHHATSSFQDEYRRLCEKHGIEIASFVTTDFAEKAREEVQRLNRELSEFEIF